MQGPRRTFFSQCFVGSNNPYQTMKKNENIDESVDIDDLDADELNLAARRQRLYSRHALKTGLPLDQIMINHSRFAKAVTAFDRVFQIAPEVTMAHGIRLIGPTGSGKSSLFRYFRDSLPKSTLFTPGFGAIGIRVGSRPTAGQIVSRLLRAYKYPFSGGRASTIFGRSEIVQDLIREKGTRLIFIDEAHRLLHQVRRSDSDEREPTATAFLLDLMDESRVALALGGTDQLDRLGKVDSHLDDRLSVRQELRHFAPASEWLGLMKAFKENCTTFDLSLILDPAEAKALNTATRGSLRRLKRLLTEAVLIGADAGALRLERGHLAKAFTIVQGDDGVEETPYA